MSDLNFQQLLDLYFHGHLSPEEKAMFEDELQKNPALQEELNFLKDAAQAMVLLKRKELLQKFNEIEKSEQQRIEEESSAFVEKLSSHMRQDFERSDSSAMPGRTSMKKIVLLILLAVFLAILVYKSYRAMN
ncbi:MAG: hypothetical protein ACOYOA_10265 [Saprospiraceae bacterium]